MADVRALFADPDAVFVEGDHGTWVVSGVATNRLRDIVVTANGLADVRSELAARSEDAVVAFVSNTDNGGHVAAFRSATSSRDLFYLTASDGSLVLTDHFRNALSQLDVADRTVEQSAVVDHLLSRPPLEPTTYVSAVSRLGRGEYVCWNGVGDEWERRVVDTLDTVDQNTPSQAVDALDEALEHVLRTDARPHARTLLSGGVDAALLASYRSGAPAPIQVSVDTPEYQMAPTGGSNPAECLDATPTVVPVTGSSLLEHLEATVDALGLPPRDPEMVAEATGLNSLEARQYVGGWGADALFGLPGVRTARVAARLGRFFDADVLERASTLASGRLASWCDSLAARCGQLERPITDPGSFAQTVSDCNDAASVAESFDESVVRRQVRRHVEYATDRASLEAESPFARQAAAGHLTSFLRGDAVTQRRQLGFQRDRSVVAPFRTRSVAEAALAVPADRRYVSHIREGPTLCAKYIPKRLLSRRRSEQPVPRSTERDSVPLERAVADGPLSAAFERYESPTFLAPGGHARNVEACGPLTWELLTYSVWRDRVLHEDDLDLVPGTRVRYLRLPQEPAAPPT